MKKLSIILLTSTVLAFNTSSLFATSSHDPSKAISETTQAQPFKDAREKLNNMSPEKRKAFIQNARTKWEKLSPEDKLKFKTEMREKMDLMKKQHAERKMVKIYSLYLIEQGQE